MSGLGLDHWGAPLDPGGAGVQVEAHHLQRTRIGIHRQDTSHIEHDLVSLGPGEGLFLVGEARLRQQADAPADD